MSAVKIDRLSDNRVLVRIGESELSAYELDYESLSFDNERSKKILLDIMHRACKKSGIETVGKRVIIEAIMLDRDVYILISVEQKSRRFYRLKSPSQAVCYMLGESGNFLDAIEKLYRERVLCNRNSVYLYENRYYLIFDYPSVPKRLRSILSEYGQSKPDRVNAARIKETGRLICEHNAILQIGRHLV